MENIKKTNKNIFTTLSHKGLMLLVYKYCIKHDVDI